MKHTASFRPQTGFFTLAFAVVVLVLGATATTALQPATQSVVVEHTPSDG